MFSAALTKVAAAVPDDVVPLRIVPQRRLGQWTAAVVVLVLLGLALTSVARNKAFQWDVGGDYFTSASALRGGTLKGASIVSVIAVQDLLSSVRLVHHRTCQVIPLLTVATLWYIVVTSELGVGRHYVVRHYARGSERTR